MENRISTFKGGLACLLLLFVMVTLTPTAVFSQVKGKEITKSDARQIIKESSNSIRFVENKGQLPAEVKAMGTTNVGYMYLKTGELYFVSTKTYENKTEASEEHDGDEHDTKAEEDETEEEEAAHYTVAHRWGIEFAGYNPAYTIENKNELPTKYSFFLNQDVSKAATNVSSFGEIELASVYSGIDLRMYSQQKNTLEYDWIVNPGADYHNIQMKFKGAEGISMDEKGNLNIKLHFDKVKFDIPESYQIIDGKKVPVTMTFAVKGDVVTFATNKNIDSRYPLIIDPSLKWGTWFDDNDGNFDEYIFAVDEDAAGNVYVAGGSNNQFTRAYTGNGTVYGYDDTYNDGVTGTNVSRGDAIIYKIKNDGTALLNITYFGGTSWDRAYGLSLSPDFSTVYICGVTNADAGASPNIPLTGTAFDATKNGQDGFVAVFNSGLTSLLYSSYVGGNGTGDEMYTIRAIDNNSYVIGGIVTDDVNFGGYITAGAFQTTYRGSTEMYIGKWTNFNTRVFGTYVGGTGVDALNDLLLYPDGAIAFSGSSTSPTSFPTLVNNVANGIANSTGNTDGVIGVLNSNGASVATLSRFGGSSADEFFGLAIGPFDTLFVTGFTASNNFYLGANSAGNRFQTSKDGGNDGFIGKMPRTGWDAGATSPWVATYFGGNGDDRGNTLRLYTPYAVMVFGETGSNDFPVLNLADGGTFYDGTFNNGSWDIFYNVLGTNLTTQYFATYIGGSGNDYLGATGVPKGSNHFKTEGDSLITLGTTTHSTSLTPNPIGGGGFDQGNSGGGNDVHLIFKWRIGILLNFDYSDAPASYGSPNHVVFNSLKLGSTIDKEDFPLPSYKSDSDDHIGATPDDEDGIAGQPTQVLVQDTSTRFTQTVNVTNATGVKAMLMGWIDFNENGTFDNNEVDTALVNAGGTSATLTWTGYNVTNTWKNAPKDTSYLRLRLTTDPAFYTTTPSPTANASNGEVEDYLVIRFHCVDLTGATIDTNSTNQCGAATGSIVIVNNNLVPGVSYGVYYTKNGGAPQGPFFYTAANGTGTLTITGLTAGTYTTVQVFHPTNPACAFTLPGNYVIKDPARASAGPDQTICQPASTANLGTAPQGTWSFISGPVTATVNPTTGAVTGMTSPGNYFFQLGSGNCADTVKVAVGQTPIICLLKRDLPCANNCQGQISLTLCNDPIISSFTVLWSTGSTATTLNNLCAGNYSVTVTDPFGCSATSSIAIQTQTSFTSALSITEPDFNQTNGALDLTPVGGTTPYTYLWSTGATTQDLANIGPGVYCVTITDASGQVITNQAIIRSGGFVNAGSIIIDMGVLPQTFDNALEPYGMIYDMVRNFNVPVKWIIKTGKVINPMGSPARFDVDFSIGSKDYKGGPFVIDADFLTTPVRNKIATWQADGVQLDTVPTAMVLPIYQTITSFPNAVIDQQNEGLVIPYYDNSKVPSASYRVGLPSDLTSCDDVYALPHADPTWATHNFLRTFNTVSKGYIWSGCHAVSVLEGIFNPSNNTQRMNFLSNTGLQCYGNNGCGSLITETHAGSATTPFSYDTTLGSEPIMQMMGDMTPAQSNGSEEWYIPLSTGSWRATTKTAVRTNNAPGTNRQGVKMAYGPGYGDSNNGMVMYEAGHRANGTVASEVAFERGYFNFLLMTGIQKRLNISAVDVPAGFYAGITDTLSITVSGGQAPYTVQWSSGCSATFGSPTSLTTSFTLPANTPINTRCIITATVRDACGRINIYSKGIVTIPPVDPLNYVRASVDSALCFAQCNGQITGHGSGGTPPYTYAWSNGATTASISGLCAGSYTLTVTDAVNCASIDVITIAQPAPITASFNVTNATCIPLANGSVATTVSGGKPNYTYAWSTGATTANLSNVAAGTYRLTVTDANTCTATFSVTVNNATVFTPTASSNKAVYCSGETISLTATGGGTYSWSGPALFSSTLSNPTRANATTNFTGTYTVSVTSPAGCTATASVNLTVNQTPSAPSNINASPNPACVGNTLTLTATGTALVWTYPDGPTANGSPVTRTNITTGMAGIYSVTQTVTGCTSPPATVNVVINPTPVITGSSSINPTTCGGTQGSITLTGLAINTPYSVTYTKNPGGAQSGNFTSNGSGFLTITGLTAGTYTNFVVTVVATGCPSANFPGPITLTDPSSPATPSPTSNTPVCSGNAINLFMTTVAGATYSWTGVNGDGSFTSNQEDPIRNNSTTAMSGLYCVTTTVANCTSAPGCTNVVVNQTPGAPTAAASPNPLCSGQNLTLTATGDAGATFNWTFPDGGTATGAIVARNNVTTGMSGVYQVTQTVNGCTSTAPGFVNVVINPTPAAPTAAAAPNPICSGNTLTLTATGTTGATFTWVYPDGGGAVGNPVTRNNVTTAMGGTYSVTQTVSGCTSTTSGTVNVTVNQTPAAPTAGASPNPICSGNTLTLSASGVAGATFTWVYPDGGGATGNPVTRANVTTAMSGVYSVSQTVLGCTSTTPGTVNVVVNQTPPAPTGAASPNPICSGENLTLTATGLPGATFTWTFPDGGGTTGNPVVRNAVTTAMGGTYTVTQTVTGCSSTTAGTVNVVINQTPATPSAFASPNPICTGNTLTLTANGVLGATFNWVFPGGITATGSVITRPNVNTSMAGVYTVTQTVNNCTSTTPATVTVTVNATPNNPSASNNGPVCQGHTIVLSTPLVSGASYSWTGPSGFSSNLQNPTIINATLSNGGTYNVIVTVNGCSSTAAGTTTVVVQNCTPIAVRDVYSNCAGTTITGNILANDVDPSGDGIQVTLPHVCGPFTGSIVVNSGGNFTYTPTGGFNGVDSICYRVCNVNFPSVCDTGIAVFDYTCTNLPPVAVDDRYTIPEDDTLTGNVTVNDFDPDGGILTVDTVPTCNPQHGTVDLNADGSFTYIPNLNYNGPDTFCYQVCDNGVPIKCANAIAVITVLPVNDPPFVPDTIVTTPEDTPTTVCLTITDVEVNTQSHSINICGNPLHGTITSGPTINNPLVPRTVCLTYTPIANYNGEDSICLIICDNGSPAQCDTSHIHIIVTPVNDPPVALNDNYTTNEDVPIVTNSLTGVRNNDNDNADGNPVTSLTVNTTPVVNVSHGTLVLNSDGSFTYTPTANFFGSDSFQYVVCDAGTPLPSLCDTATAYITVVPVNDPPVVPDTTVTIPEDSIITVCLPITDAENGTQQHIALLCDAPDNGVITQGPIVSNINNTVCITYRPGANFNGNDSICLTICDNGVPSLCDDAIIHIVVTPVNDPPVALNDNYTTNEDVTLNVPVGTGVRVNDNDNLDGNPVTSLTVDPVPTCGPVNGTLTVLNGNGSFTYVPNPGFNGVDSFCYRVCDNGTPLPSLCDTAVAYITINQVNDPPQIPDTPVVTCEDCPITVCIPFSDADSTQIHTQTLLCNPVHGTVTNVTISDVTHTLCFTYQGYTNINGMDSLCFVVCDNGIPVLCDTTHVPITITPVNDPPYADTIYVVTYQEVPVGVNVASATGDIEGDPLSYTYGGVVPGGGGTFYITGNGAIVFVPAPGFVGTATIPYGVCDLSPYPINVLCDSAAIVITVLPPTDTLNNHAPVASNDYVTTPLNTGITVNELANDYDPDGDPLQVTITGSASHGTTTTNPNGTVNYTPNTGYFGFDSIHYVICDPVGSTLPRPLCDDAYIIIYISPDSTAAVNDPPVAVDDFKIICADASTTISVLNNDYDPNGDNIVSSVVISNFIHGSNLNPGLGFYVYTPNPGFSGNDTMQYRICDNGTPSLCDTATVIVIVNPTPVITPSANSLSVCSGDPVVVTFTSNVPGTVINWTGSNGTSGTGNINTVLTNNTTISTTVTYTVSAATPDGCASNTLSIPVTVGPRPVVSHFVNNTIFCSGQQVVINLSSNIGGTTFTWSGSNGSSGTGNIVTDNPTNTGVIDSTVVYTINSNFNGCAGTPVNVSVLVHPKLVLTANPSSQAICSGTPITIGITSNLGGATILWTGSNGNSGNTFTINDSPVNTSGGNITITYSINGSANGCSSATTFATVVVHPQVNADAGQDKTVTSCAAACVTLGGSPTGSGGGGTLTYDWTPNAFLSDTAAANPSACNVTANTTYTVVVTDGNNCTATDQVAVTITPSTLVAEAGSGGALCLGSGDSVMLGGFPTAVGGTPAYTYTWSPLTGLNLTNPANPEAYPPSTTTYHLTVTDAQGCTSVDSTVVTAYPTLVANAGADTMVCATFAAQLGGNPTASGGSGAGYAYLWSPSVGVSDVSIANPTATPTTLTTYTVLVVDANGCSATDVVMVTVRPNPTAHAGVDKSLVACAGDSITIGDIPAVTGGTGPFTYRWLPSTGLSDSTAPNPVVKGLTATTTYTLLVTDASGCSSTDNVTITVIQNSLQAHAGPDAAVCSNNNCHQLGGIPTAVGGTAPYLYMWNHGTLLDDSTDNNPVACPTGTTTFTVTVTDSKGCLATDAIVITVNPSPVTNAGPDTTVCSGLAVRIGGNPTASGGTPGYTYTWLPTVGLSNPTVANPTAAPISITTYQVIVTDSKGCSSLDEVMVTPRSNPVVDAGSDRNLVACAGDTVFIGGLPAVTGGGTAPFVYDWTYGTGLSDSTIANPLVTGITSTTSYQLMVTDTFGCIGTDFITVFVLPSTLQVDAGNGSAICASAGNPVTIGGIPTAVGGTSPYVYTWASTDTSFHSNLPNPVVTPATTTVYYVTVVDAKGCAGTDSVTVIFRPAPVANAGPDSTLCSGFCVSLGTANTGSGGSSPYQYSWTPAVGLNANNTANPLACPLVTTTYNVQVTDSNGCVASDNVTITIHPVPVANAGIDKSMVNCSSDSVMIGGTPAASGGVGPYTYQWSPALGLSGTTIANPVVRGLTTSQLYTLAVTDANGCTAEDAVLITVNPSSLVAEAGSNASFCKNSGSSVVLGGSGGNPTAAGGTGPYTYTWSPAGSLDLTNPANPIATPDTTTSYHLTITDSKGCMAFDSVKITVHPAVTACAGRDTAICFGNSITLGCGTTANSTTANGGTAPYTYLWGPANGLNNTGASNPTATPQFTTNYTVRVIDANGCQASDGVLVTVHQLPVADAGADKSLVGCSADSVQIGGSPSASGGTPSYHYQWVPGVLAGVSNDTIANPYVSLIGSTITYTLIVTDSFGCADNDQVTVNVTNSTLTAEAGNDVAFCAGANVSVTLGGNPTACCGTPLYTYLWIPGGATTPNPVVSPTNTTTYTVIVIDAAGCRASDTVRVTVNPRPVVSAGLADTLCAGACKILGGTPTASGGTGSYTYTWSPTLYFSTGTNVANPVACPQASITYAVTATDSLGCSNNASIDIRVNQNPVANAGSDQSVVACANACVTLGGSPTATGGGGGYQYAWAPTPALNNSGLSNPQACNVPISGTYTVTVTDVNGCTGTDQMFLTVTQSTLAADAGPDKSICAGQPNCVTIGGTTAASGGALPYSISWSPVQGICNSNIIPNPDVNPTDTTTYVLLVTDAQGCIAVDSMVLYANPAVTASVDPDTAICQGGAALLGSDSTGSGGTPFYTYSWSPGVGLSNISAARPVATPASTTTYCVTVTDAVGCSASTCQTVTVNPGLIADAGADRNYTNCPGSSTTLGGSPTGSGGSTNYSFAWSPSGNLNGSTVPNPIVTGLTQTTTFTVTVTDNATGCSATDQVTVTVLQSSLVANAGSDQIFCASRFACLVIGGNPTAVGGQSPYIYQWAPTGSMNDPTIANPCVGPLNTTTYVLTLTDALGCSKVDTTVVTVSPFIIVNAGADDSICRGTSIVLGGNPPALGGTGVYTYAWSTGAFPGNSAHPTATPLTATSYTLTVTDSLGCTASDIVNIALRNLPVANAGADDNITQCSLDSSVLGGNPTGSGTIGPYTYSWFPPTGLDNPTAANPVVDSLGNNVVYTVTVTDSFGCQATDQVQISVTQVVINVAAGNNSTTAALCANNLSCVTLGGFPVVTGGNGTGPYTYQWVGPNLSNANIEHALACPTDTSTYAVVVTDANGCRASDTVQLIVNDPPHASVSGVNSQYCVTAGNVTMTGIPAGGTFSGPGVTGNLFQPASVGAGFYCIVYTYTDPVTHCSDDTTFCITVNPLPVLSVSGYSPTYCRSDSAITLVGSPAGGTFTGSPGLSGANGATFNPATATVGNNVITYSYTDAATGCSNTFVFVINIKASPTISIVAATDTSCLGAPVVITPTFSFDVFNIVYSLQGGGVVGAGLNPFSYTPATTGDYCVVAMAINTPNSCLAYDTICGHVNLPPVANDDVAATCEEQPVTITVLTNDTDPEGNANNVTVISTAHGTSTVSNNVITYTGNLNYNGSDTVVYQLCNVACVNACDTGMVVVSVCAVNDTPTIISIVDTVPQNTPDTLCPPIADVDDALNTLTVSIIPCGPVNGTVTMVGNCVVFTPTFNWTGTQVICVQVCDPHGACDTGTVTAVVVSANHAPIAQPVTVVKCQRAAGIGVNVAAGATDPDGNLMTFAYGPVTGGVGTWVVTGNGSGAFVTNTPGTYTIQYTVCDISNVPVAPLCDTSTITITVVDCDTTNLPPVASPDAAVTTTNTLININELANDYDPDGDPLAVSILCGPSLAGATVTLQPNGTINYTSPVTGTDTICYSICDPSGLCDTTIIVVVVNPVAGPNHPPVAVDDYASTPWLTPVNVPVMNNDHDPDGNPITVQVGIPCLPQHGQAQVQGNGTITYTPDSTANAYTPDSFCYVICDNGIPALCDTAVVHISIPNSVVAVNECTQTGYAHPIVINAVGNDYDPDHDSIWITTTVNLPITHGTTFVDNKGKIHYIPMADSCGYIDTFAYILTDAAGSIDTGYVCVDILCCAPPVGMPDTAQVASGDSVAIVVTLNDTISGPLTINDTLIAPQHGTAHFIDSSTVIYTPNAGFCGRDTFFYHGENICGFDTGMVVVNVICNTKPVAVNDSQSVCRFDTLTFYPMANDTDADGNPLHIVGVGPLSTAGVVFIDAFDSTSVTIISTGTISTASFQYYICDNGLPVKCDTATEFIQVMPCTVPVVDDIYDTIQSCVPHDSICINAYVHLTGPYTWTINQMCAPQNGTLVNSTSCFTYTPNTGFFGNDTFCAIVCTNIGLCDTAMIVMTTVDCIITAVDEPCDLDTTIINTPDTIDVLANDIIPWAGDTVISLLTQPLNGAAVVNANNTVTYTPHTDYKGTDEFTYLVCAQTGTYIYCDTANVCITVIDTNVNCYIPNAFSPNGDGSNDLYTIPCQGKTPLATLRIYDRWGVEVWYSDGAYQNNWNGTNMQGTPLPDGTYYIIYEYNDGSNKREAKFVVIQR